MKKIREELDKIMLFVGLKAKLIKMFLIAAAFVLAVPNYAFAGTNYGENFGKYALDQLFWVAVVLIAVALIGSAIKRNVVGIVVSIIIGAVVIGFIGDPTGIKTVGQDIWNTIKG